MPIKTPVQLATATEYKKALAADLRKLDGTLRPFVWVPSVKIVNVPGVLFVGNKKTDPVVDDFLTKNKVTQSVAGSISRNDAQKIIFSATLNRGAVNKVINDLKQNDLTDIVDLAGHTEESGETSSVSTRPETPRPTTPPPPRPETEKPRDAPPKPLDVKPPSTVPPSPRKPDYPPPPVPGKKPETSSPGNSEPRTSLFGSHRSNSTQNLSKPPLPNKDSVPPSPPEEDFSEALEEAKQFVVQARLDANGFAKKISAARQQIDTVKKYQDKKYEKLGFGEDFKRLNKLADSPTSLLDTIGADLDRAEQELKRAIESKDETKSDLAKAAIDTARGTARKVAVAARGLSNIEAGVKFIERTAKEAEKLQKRLEAIDLKRVTDIKQRVALLDDVATSGADDEQKEILQQLVLATALAPDKISAEIASCTNPTTTTAAIGKLRKKTKSSDEAREVFAQCHLLVNDVFRYYGDAAAFSGTLPAKLKTALTEVMNVANAEYTLGMMATVQGATEAQNVGLDDSEQIKPDPKSAGRTVAVAGGGPVGLLAAIESAMRGAKVEVYEARGGESQKELHNRMNTIKLEDGTLQRFRKVGVWSAVVKKWDSAARAVPVGVLETALLDRARSLGVKFFAGKTVVDAVKLDTGKVELTIDGAKDKAYVDLVVVAAGAGFARASASSLNAEKLGFEIVKMEARDFAVTGVYEPTSEDKNTGPKNVGGVGWSYGFDAPDVKYLVAQISEEQFEEFQRDPTKLAGYVREAAIRQNIGDREYKKTPTGREVKPGFFPIEVQQAQGMTSKKSGAVLVGDSAATPHPSTAKGLNTGSREIDYISDLVSGRDGETEDEALSSYDWETTRATNVMVAAAMASMASEAKARCTKTIARTLAKAAISTPPEFDDARKLLKRVEAEVVIPLGEACKTDDGSNDWALTSRNIKRLREIEKPLAVIFDMASKPDPKPQEIEKLLRPLLV